MSKANARSASDWIDARAAYVSANAKLKAADKEIKDAESALTEVTGQQASSETEAAKAVVKQEQLVALTKKGYGAVLDSYGSVTVYEWWVAVPGGGGPAKGAQASVSRVGALTTYNTVNVQVKKKGGLGGAAVGGLLLGPVGAVAGYAVRRKTDVTTTNTPHREDTRQELVQISGKGYAYTATFSGWGFGTSLANAINRRSSVTSTAKQELPKREEQLERLIDAATSGKQASKSAIGKATRVVDVAWDQRDAMYRDAVSRWKVYSASRPSLGVHFLATLIPGVKRKAFNALAPILLIASVGAGLYSATGSISSLNIADGIALISALGLTLVFVHARQSAPTERSKIAR